MQTQHCSQFLHTRQTIPAMLSSNYIASTHNITYSPYTSTCTTHPAIPSPLPSTTLLCTQLTNTKHSWQNGSRCRDGVNVLRCRSHLVWMVFWGFHPYMHLFSFGKLFLWLVYKTNWFVHLHSSHCFLSTWGADSLKKEKRKKILWKTSSRCVYCRHLLDDGTNK